MPMDVAFPGIFGKYWASFAPVLIKLNLTFRHLLRGLKLNEFSLCNQLLSLVTMSFDFIIKCEESVNQQWDLTIFLLK